LMVVQGELQNATDACALSAAAELNGLPGASLRAAASGSRVASALNRQNFQTTPVQISSENVLFIKNLNDLGSIAASALADSYRFVECKATYTGWINLFMDWAGFGGSLPIATSRAGLQKTSKVCAPPLALVVRTTTAPGPDFGYTVATTSAVVLANLRYADLVSTSLIGTDTQYANLLAQSGVCGVTTVAGTLVGVDGPNTMAASLSAALKTRYESDPTYGNVAGLSNRRLMAVPFVSASSTTNSTVQGWACLELGPGGSVSYRGDARKLNGLLPSSNCVTTGVGGKDAQGPYAPTLAR
jgi:hypothetical protein